MIVPIKPFPKYKWRWAAYTPTEGLNDPRVFLGVLRALKACEGQSPTSPDLAKALRHIQNETGTSVDLVRSNERNLIRNSGQYWKALNLLSDSRGKIVITEFGRMVADGIITRSEFSSIIIKTFELPNRIIETNTYDWDINRLRIKPFELILTILVGLQEETNIENAFITTEELIRITIPLAGAKASLSDHVGAILSNRSGALIVDTWPDCASSANDKRMAREFLLFLCYYDICGHSPSNDGQEKYYLKNLSSSEVLNFINSRAINSHAALPAIVQEIRESNFPETTERKRILTEMLSRPQQALFRKAVLKAHDSRCLLTMVNLEQVLEAAHIIPVKDNGSDKIENGLCLRSDIHLLFDSGHLRIDPFGVIHLSETASKHYISLPSRIELPSFINKRLLEHRWKYY
jgi:hypothetical protein